MAITQNVAVNKTVCTRCGKPMVERVAKKGANAGQTFLGCSGYPECKNTVELPSKAQLELMEDRYGQKSTIVTSQLPVEAWHEAIGDLTLADAILDRIIHNAHKINLKGESMRKQSNSLHQTDHLG